ncbi:MAG: TrbC/VirB2 family protein [bacterium]
MKLSTKVSAGAIITTSLALVPAIALAADAAGVLPNPLKNVSSISDLLYLIADILTYIGAILAVLALIWVGFKFVAAQGKPDKLTTARHDFFAILIGVAILVGASAIVTILKNSLTNAGVVSPSAFTK